MSRNMQVSIVLLLTLFSSIRVLADKDCKKVKPSNYQLFATKTKYEEARKYVSAAKDLPKSFGDASLEEEMREMTLCEPVMFYFIGRHAARFPDSEDIENYNKKLAQLRDSLRAKGSAHASECGPYYSQLYNWTSKMEPKLDNLITEVGALEQRDIARRFKRLLPKFFNTQAADVKIGVSSKLRTAQTAAEFLKEVDGLNIQQCRTTPTHDILKSDFNPNSSLKSPCYKTLLENNYLPFLEFHKQCEKIGGKDVGHPDLAKLDDPKVIKKIVSKVGKRLDLPSDVKIDADTVDNIYDMCKFETGFMNQSVWCNLFEKDELEILEYIKDAGVYLKDAYGPDSRSKQACLLIKDLIETIKVGMNMTGSPSEKKKSYFYFTHAEVLKKLYPALKLFKDSDSYKESRLEDLVDDLEIAEKRNWRTSLTVPFSANMAFILYKCPSKSDGDMKHKLIATVTERPVKLKDCDSTRCKAKKFLDSYQDMMECDLKTICVKKLK